MRVRETDFFRDEVRCGFYIPTAIKQAWAATLDVLDEIDRICRKYDVRYFADWGTLLGTVRHGGFVPWDDDLDICMLREDYRRFREVADAELPKRFVIHDYERQKDHWLFLARVVNNAHFCFDEAYLREHYNFPWLAGVDIFVKDYLYRDPEAEKCRDRDVLRLIALADGIREGTINETVCAAEMKHVEQKYGIELPSLEKRREIAIALYRIAEQRMAEVPGEESDEVGQIFPHVLKGMPGLPKADYDRLVRLPFEDVTMPVPAAYHRMLTSRYGDYCKVHKVWGGHDYPFFEGQKAELERVAGEKLPGFVFDERMLLRPLPERMQDFGSGEKNCSILKKRREVLFLPIGPSEWKSGMERVWKKESARRDTDCVVVPLPLMPKDFFGQVDLSEEEIIAAGREEEYPEDLGIVHWWEYDLEERCPDVIYIQNPYDGSNPYLTVPEVYFADNLRHHTPYLVYLPIAKTAEFTSEDVTDCYNMKHYVTAPGVVYADRVIVQSEIIRARYIEALTAFAGEKTRNAWEEKILVEDAQETEGADKPEPRQKKILFAVGVHVMAEYGDGALDAIRSRLDTFQDAADKIAAEIILYSQDKGQWIRLDKELYEKLFDMIRVSGIAVCEVVDEAHYDAYYGSPTPWALDFAQAGKPVMLADYGVG